MSSFQPRSPSEFYFTWIQSGSGGISAMAVIAAHHSTRSGRIPPKHHPASAHENTRCTGSREQMLDVILGCPWCSMVSCTAVCLGDTASVIDSSLSLGLIMGHCLSSTYADDITKSTYVAVSQLLFRIRRDRRCRCRCYPARISGPQNAIYHAGTTGRKQGENVMQPCQPDSGSGFAPFRHR